MSNHVHKHYFSLIALFVLLSSGCPFGQEPDEFFFDCFVVNESNSSVKVLLHLRGNLPPYDSVFIAPGEMSSIGRYFATGWSSYDCDARKIQFIFENGKGYVCTLRPDNTTNDSALCFLGAKDPFVAPQLPNEGFGSITTITQEDFENAFEL
ncbi:hypothetical protein QWY85_13365 [Neolewinella lacunae]|uniref:Uncharacterized protein n=1 Tax=Neolewinella lacunae TaxID=1517758 RepID=A0A923PRV6_9BACT|nr:hypothetical protein [Neolewinella lacunae]MBC6995617.1 hypothetical protein [Neolewinella lacunae]MDN3635653.1 hypothetical protein [Neolewinella lacunae]